MVQSRFSSCPATDLGANPVAFTRTNRPGVSGITIEPSRDNGIWPVAPASNGKMLPDGPALPRQARSHSVAPRCIESLWVIPLCLSLLFMIGCGGDQPRTGGVDLEEARRLSEQAGRDAMRGMKARDAEDKRKDAGRSQKVAQQESHHDRTTELARDVDRVLDGVNAKWRDSLQQQDKSLMTAEKEAKGGMAYPATSKIHDEYLKQERAFSEARRRIDTERTQFISSLRASTKKQIESSSVESSQDSLETAIKEAQASAERYTSEKVTELAVVTQTGRDAVLSLGATLRVDNDKSVSAKRSAQAQRDSATQVMKNAGDIRALTVLDIDVATAVVRSSDGAVHLDSVRDLSPEVAAVLSQCKVGLYLPSIEKLTATAEERLAEKKVGKNAPLEMRGIVEIKTPALASALSANEPNLSLPKVTQLSAQVAGALSRHKGYLDLSGLTSLTPDAAESLASTTSRLNLAGLEALDSVALARTLCTQPDVMLQKVKTVSADAAEVLASSSVVLHLPSLEELNSAALARKILAQDNQAGLQDLRVNQRIILSPPVRTLVQKEQRAMRGAGNRTFKGEASLSDKELGDVIDAAPNLAQLDLRDCVNLTDSAFDHLAKLSSVDRLQLPPRSGMTPEGFMKLRGVKVAHISVPKRFLDDPKCLGVYLRMHHDLGKAGRNRDAKDGMYDDMHLSYGDAGLRQYAGMGGVHALYLPSEGITDKGLESIADIPDLILLNVSLGRGITNKGLAAIAKCKKLQGLTLSDEVEGKTGAKIDTEVTTAGLASLEPLALSILEIPKWMQTAEAVGGYVDALAESSSRRQHVSLDGHADERHPSFPGTPESVQGLKGKPGIRSISIKDGEQIDDAALSSVLQVPDLEELTVWESRDLNGDGFKGVAGAPSLRNIFLSKCPNFSDIGLKHLSSSKTLTKIAIFGSRRLSEDAILGLERCGQLKHIAIHDVNVGPSVEIRLENAIPGCVVDIKK